MTCCWGQGHISTYKNPIYCPYMIFGKRQRQLRTGRANQFFSSQNWNLKLTAADSFSQLFCLCLFIKFTSFNNWQITFIYWCEFMIRKTQTGFTGYTFLTKNNITTFSCVSPFSYSKIKLQGPPSHLPQKTKTKETNQAKNKTQKNTICQFQL